MRVVHIASQARSSAGTVRCLLAILVAVGCASVKTESTAYGNEPEQKAAEEPAYPEYDGPRKLVQVIRFGIPNDVLEKYEELADKKVGWGLCNRIVDELYDTDRFDYIEEKDEFLKRVLEQWTAEEAGILMKDETRQRQAKSPDYLVYAEVYDFGVSNQERIIGLKKRDATVTKMGVQIRFVDTKTMQYTPASEAGESVREKGRSVFAGVDDNFDETQVGMAAEQAIRNALVKVLKRMDRER